ncbi:MAG: FAD:protein FMN transferase [Candidatus Levybacteria bacterium]|nr:FAD:protein FMN transferase [Candidatus Levybacteria bacterium]
MKITKIIMGMPIAICVVDKAVDKKDIESIFTFFKSVDKQFSPYRKTSEVSKINRNEILLSAVSDVMKEILELSIQTKKDTHGYFDVDAKGYFDPSGMVKGWAIEKAVKMLKKIGYKNFFIDAGGDMFVSGSKKGSLWNVGIRNPFNRDQIVKILELENCAIATSGTTIRGQHIVDPYHDKTLTEIVSMSVVGPSVIDADRFATAAFAMGRDGISFIESQEGVEGYMIDKHGMATYTSGFTNYVLS